MSDDAEQNTGPSWPAAPGEVPPPTVPAEVATPAEAWAPVAPAAGVAPAKKKSRAGLIIGLAAAAVVVVAAAIGGIVVLSGGDSFPDSDQKALIRAIPGDVKAADCKARSAEGAVAASVTCEVNAGAQTVTATKFKSADATGKGFKREENVVELSDSVTSDCIDRDKVEHDYTSNFGYDGRVLCYRKGGRSVIAWSKPDQRIVFVANRTDKQDVKLYRWWAGGIARRWPTVDQVNALKDHAPKSAEECQSARPFSGSIAAIRCDGTGGASVYLTQYDKGQDMADKYVELLDATGLDQGENAGTSSCPLEGAIDTQGTTTGRVFCTYDGDGKAPRIVFTDETDTILVEVLGDDGDDGDQLFVQWGVGSYDPQ